MADKPPLVELRDRSLADMAEVINHVYGPRCPDYDDGCMTCRAWKLIDDLEKLTDEAKDHP
jgi:hypothetical protein